MTTPTRPLAVSRAAQQKKLRRVQSGAQHVPQKVKRTPQPTTTPAGVAWDDGVNAMPAPAASTPCIRWPEHEALRRKRWIKMHGQPAQLDVAFLDDELLALIVTPLEGWVHLVQDPAECAAAFGPYHVSICQASLASNEDVQALRDRFAGLQLTIPVQSILNEGFLELADCTITQDETFHRLHSHQHAWYRDRSVHISA